MALVFRVFHNTNGKVDNLKRQLEELKRVREYLHQFLGAGLQNGEIDVQRWLNSVAEIVTQVEDNLNLNGRRGVKGFLSHAWLGREVKKLTDVVISLLNEGRLICGSLEAAATSNKTALALASHMIETSSLKDVMEALKGERFNCIGIYGMVGVGKTTLVEQVAKWAKEEELFDEIVMATVNANSNISRIQDRIADMLGLIFDLRSLEGRAERLQTRLQSSQRVLVVLDDVRDALPLEDIGIPVGSTHRGLKVIITTRLRRVCKQMGTQKDFCIRGLTEQDAWDLFKKVVGSYCESLDLKPVAREVVARCGGLPPAIMAVGRELKNRRKTFWDGAVFQLKNPHNNILLPDLFSAIESSYSHLERVEMRFFLLCCLFPENRDIASEDLFRHGMGLGLFREAASLKEARLKAQTMAGSIKDLSLLVDSEKTGYVKMNTLVRSFAVSIACSDEYRFALYAGAELEEWSKFPPHEKCTAMLLATNAIHELPNSLECRDLQILVIEEKNLQLKIPDSFFCYMEKLQVLVLIGMRNLVLPSSLRLLVNLQTLHLNRCKVTSMFPLKTLRRLEILSFSESRITNLPLEIRCLTSLRLLDLTNCEYVISVLLDILSSLSQLEELYLGNLIMQGKVEKGVERSVNHPHAKSGLCRVLRVRDHQSLRKIFSPSIVKCLVLQVLEISDVHEMEEILGPRKGEESSQEISLSWPESLVLQHLPNLTSFCRGNYSVKWTLLKSVRVENCPRVVMFALGNMHKDGDLHLFTNKVVFPQLEQLHLICLENLIAVWQGSPPSTSFTELRFLELDNCGKLLKAVPNDMIKKLSNLETIVARNCDLLRELIDFGEIVAEDHSVMLPQLREMMLTNLPELVQIWKSPTQIMFCHNLRVLIVSNCKKLRTLFSPAMVSSLSQLETLSIDGCEALEGIVEAKGEVFQPLEGFQNLKVLQVLYCNRLKLSIAGCLVQLQVLKICGCQMIDRILVEDKGDTGTSDMIIFPHLSCIILKELPNLANFYSGSHVFVWPSLETLRVKDCPKMETFALKQQITPKLKAVEVSFIEKLWSGDLNKTIREHFENENRRRMDSDNTQSSATKTVWSAHMAWARWFYDACIPFEALHSPYFQQALDATTAIGPGYKGPSYNDMRVHLFRDCKKECQLLVESYRSNWANSGCTIMADVWSDEERQKTWINFLVYCPAGISFVKSVDILDVVNDEQKLLNLFSEIVEWVGAKNVVHIVTDDASKFVAAGKLLHEKYDNIYWSPCATHCLNLILKDIGSMKHVAHLALCASKVTIFVYKHTILLSWLRERPGWKEIVQSGVTCFATAFIALKNICDQKHDLQALVTSKYYTSHTLSKSTDGKAISAIILDSKFWDDCLVIVKIVAPIVRLLRIVESNERPSLGYFYEGIYRARKIIKIGLMNNKRLYKPYTRIIKERWNMYFRCGMHAVAYFLNPAFIYEEGFCEKVEIRNSLLDMLGIESICSEGKKAIKEIKLYRDRNGSFSQPAALNSSKTMQPDEWWRLFGDSAPLLQKIAIRVLSQTASSSGCGRNWSVFEHIHAKKRNKLGHQRLNDHVYVTYNLHLKNRLHYKKSMYDPVNHECINNTDFWMVEEEQPLELDYEEIEKAIYQDNAIPTINEPEKQTCIQDCQEKDGEFDDPGRIEI